MFSESVLTENRRLIFSERPHRKPSQRYVRNASVNKERGTRKVEHQCIMPLPREMEHQDVFCHPVSRAFIMRDIMLALGNP